MWHLLSGKILLRMKPSRGEAPRRYRVSDWCPKNIWVQLLDLEYYWGLLDLAIPETRVPLKWKFFINPHFAYSLSYDFFLWQKLSGPKHPFSEKCEHIWTQEGIAGFVDELAQSAFAGEIQLSSSQKCPSRSHHCPCFHLSRMRHRAQVAKGARAHLHPEPTDSAHWQRHEHCASALKDDARWHHIISPVSWGLALF